MSWDQISGLLRQILPFAGGILVALGWFNPDQAQTVITNIAAIIGPISTIIGIVWSIKANTKSAILTSAAAIPEVKRIEVSSQDLAASIPAPEVVAKP